jgi:hypothetical protein
MHTRCGIARSAGVEPGSYAGTACGVLLNVYHDADAGLLAMPVVHTLLCPFKGKACATGGLVGLHALLLRSPFTSTTLHHNKSTCTYCCHCTCRQPFSTAPPAGLWVCSRHLQRAGPAQAHALRSPAVRHHPRLQQHHVHAARAAPGQQAWLPAGSLLQQPPTACQGAGWSQTLRCRH